MPNPIVKLPPRWILEKWAKEKLKITNPVLLNKAVEEVLQKIYEVEVNKIKSHGQTR